MRLGCTLVGVAVLAGACMASHAVQAGDTTIGGKIYADYSYLQRKDVNDNKINPTGVGFDEKRFYVIVNHDVDNVWSMNFTSDIGDQNGAYDIFVKKAYLQARVPNSIVMVRAGSADTPWIPMAEDMYAFRYVENTLIDRLHFGNSADWGLHILGTTPDKMLNFQGSFINGGGYKKPARSKTVDFEGRVGSSPIPGLNLAVGGYLGKLGQEQQATAKSQNASRVDALASYVRAPIRIGAEFFQADKWKLVLDPASRSDKSQGVSVWAAAEVASPWTVFGRLDWAKPSKDLDKDFQDTYFNGGLQWAASKDVVVSPVFKYEKAEKSLTAGNNGKSIEFGLWAQAKF